jgi:sporulation protein YlmC with PRC-barrel domain
MLRSLKKLEKFTLKATDGEIGNVQDFYFDDCRWIVRYLVVDTSRFWEATHQVLVSPVSFRQADWATHEFHLALTVDKVKQSPGVDHHKPVSRQFEQDYFRYYGWPYYWSGDGLWGQWSYPGALAANAASSSTDPSVPGDPNLRSIQEVVGYHILVQGEGIGHVDDFIVDDEDWSIRYLVVTTNNGWLGKKILLAPLWVDQISWAGRTVSIGLDPEAIRASPEWKPDELVNREYETRLYDYYGRPGYWH